MKRPRSAQSSAGVDVERLLKKLKTAPTAKPPKPTRVVDAPVPRGKAAATAGKRAKPARPTPKPDSTPRAPGQPRTAPIVHAVADPSASSSAPSALGSSNGLGALQFSLRSKLGGSRFRWINEKLVSRVVQTLD